MNVLWALTFIFVSTILLAACASAEFNTTADVAQLARGERIYQVNCKGCHSGGQSGIGPLLKTKPLSRFYKRFEAQHGLGMIGKYEEVKLTETDLTAVANYVSAWTRH